MAGPEEQPIMSLQQYKDWLSSLNLVDAITGRKLTPTEIIRFAENVSQEERAHGLDGRYGEVPIKELVVPAEQWSNEA